MERAATTATTSSTTTATASSPDVAITIGPALHVEDLCDVIAVRHRYTRWRTRTRPIEVVVVHRFGHVLHGSELRVDDLVSMADGFAHHPELRKHWPTGAAYDLVVTADGRAQQWFPLSSYGAHSKDWNPRSVGIACLGDFRRAPPTEQQWRTLVQLVTVLRGAFRCAVKGHGELGPSATSDPTKLRGGAEYCPGELLDLEALRHVTAPRLVYDLGAFGLRV